MICKSAEMLSRGPFEEALVNMMSNNRFVNLSFYSFIIAKSKIIFDDSVDTAGVNFSGTSYNLYIGKKFKDWTLEERMAVLVHECRHIIGGHIFRKGDRNHELFNIATDISINQTIINLPKGILNPKTGKEEGGALYPSTFKFPENKTAEQYYELLLEEKKKQEKEKKEYEDENGKPGDCDNCGGSGKELDSEGVEKTCEHCEGSGLKDGGWKPSNGNPDITSGKLVSIDNHNAWVESDEGSEELARALAENMVKEAMASVERGNLPGDIENMLQLLKRVPKISWSKELRNFMASKRGDKLDTIKKKNRRFPGRSDLRGKKTHTDEHTIVVGVDTSGSMNDKDVLNGLAEILDLVKNHTKELKLIQIDTDIKDIEVFSKKNIKFKRRGYGGTYMGAIVPFIEEQKLKPDVLIMISDMYIEDIDTDKNWNNFKSPVLWLSTSGNIPNTKNKKHRVIDIKNK